MLSSQKILCALYSSCDVCFLTSAMENASMANLEALACGLPVLAFKNSGFTEVVGNNLLGENTTVEECAVKIHELLYNNKNKPLFSYGLDNTAKLYTKLYQGN